MSRRARERTLAFPNLRLVITPTLELQPSAIGNQFIARQPFTARRPCLRTSENSRDCCMRIVRGSRNRAGAGCGIVRGHLDRSQTLSAHPAAVGKNGAPALARVSTEETMLSL